VEHFGGENSPSVSIHLHKGNERTPTCGGKIKEKRRVFGEMKKKARAKKEKTVFKSAALGGAETASKKRRTGSERKSLFGQAREKRTADRLAGEG